ncbi:MAG: sugar ABC transporter substrate-binding protein [Anaerolineae bacterium]|nr:sugar ABC transporter substrate-binding protein [Anaerolineae bacterium]
MRKLFLLLLLVVIVTSLSATVLAQDESVTFWMKRQLLDECNAALEARAVQFTSETGTPVNLEIMPYEDALARWSAGIESGNVPDVSFFGYQEVGQFYGQGLLVDLSDVVAQVQEANGELVPALVNPITFEDKQWAVPFWSEGTVLYYRTDLFEQAGIDGPPETWDEFLQDAELLNDPANGIYGAGFGVGRGNSDSEWWFRDLLWSHNAYLFNAAGDASTANTPEAAAVFEWLQYLFNESGTVPPGAIGWDDAGNNRAYLAGQAAMVINVGSVYRALQTDRPDLFEVSKVALVPGGPEGRFIGGISNNLGMFEGSPNPEGGMALISYLLDKEWQQQWTESCGYLVVPVYSDLGESEFWQTDAGQVFLETPQYYVFLGAQGAFSPAAGEVYNTRLLTDAVEQVLVQGRAIEDALADLEAQINEVIAQYQ